MALHYDTSWRAAGLETRLVVGHEGALAPNLLNAVLQSATLDHVLEEQHRWWLPLDRMHVGLVSMCPAGPLQWGLQWILLNPMALMVLMQLDLVMTPVQLEMISRSSLF